MFNKSASAAQTNPAATDKVFLSWRINNNKYLAELLNANGDLLGYVRMIRLLHQEIAPLWDEEYLYDFKDFK